jgi:hypothetical protein
MRLLVFRLVMIVAACWASSAVSAGAAVPGPDSPAFRLLARAWQDQRQAGVEFERGRDNEARRLYRRGYSRLFAARGASRRFRVNFSELKRRYVFEMVILSQTIFTRGLKLVDRGLEAAGCRELGRSFKLLGLARGLGGGGQMYSRFYFSAAMDFNTVVAPDRLQTVLKRCVTSATARSRIASYVRAIRGGRTRGLRRSLGVAAVSYPRGGYPVADKVRWLTTRKRAFVRAALLRARRHLPLIKRVFKSHGIPPGLAYMALIESGFQTDPVSRAGAVGLWQFMPQTARDYGLKVAPGVDERLDPAKSTYAAARYLRNLYRRFKDWPLAVAAYNCGEGTVEALIRRTGRKTYWQLYRNLPPETREFVAAVMAAGVVGTGGHRGI